MVWMSMGMTPSTSPAILCVFFFQETRWSDPGSGNKTNSQRLIFTTMKAPRANNFKAWRMITPGFIPFSASPNRKCLCILGEIPVKCLWKKADFDCFKKGSERSSLAQGSNSGFGKENLKIISNTKTFFSFTCLFSRCPSSLHETDYLILFEKSNKK